jgi:hypothetical protein
MPEQRGQAINMPTVEDIAEGFLRYDDLQKLKIVSSRSDLHDKQQNLGFPLPIKPSRKVALFLKSEVIEWLMGLVAKRDTEHERRNACKMAPMAGVERISEGAAATSTASASAHGKQRRPGHRLMNLTTKPRSKGDAP